MILVLILLNLRYQRNQREVLERIKSQESRVRRIKDERRMIKDREICGTLRKF
jgi:hypothetical protein